MTPNRFKTKSHYLIYRARTDKKLQSHTSLHAWWTCPGWVAEEVDRFRDRWRAGTDWLWTRVVSFLIRWSWISRYKKSSPRLRRTFTLRKCWAEKTTIILSGLPTFMNVIWGWSGPKRLPSWISGLPRVERIPRIRNRGTSLGTTTMTIMSTCGKALRLCFVTPKKISYHLISNDEPLLIIYTFISYFWSL